MTSSRVSVALIPSVDDSSSTKNFEASTASVRAVESVPGQLHAQNPVGRFSSTSVNRLTLSSSTVVSLSTAAMAKLSKPSKSVGRTPSTKVSSSSVGSARRPVPIVASTQESGEVGRPKRSSTPRSGSAPGEGLPLSSPPDLVLASVESPAVIGSSPVDLSSANPVFLGGSDLPGCEESVFDNSCSDVVPGLAASVDRVPVYNGTGGASEPQNDPVSSWSPQSTTSSTRVPVVGSTTPFSFPLTRQAMAEAGRPLDPQPLPSTTAPVFSWPASVSISGSSSDD